MVRGNRRAKIRKKNKAKRGREKEG